MLNDIRLLLDYFWMYVDSHGKEGVPLLEGVPLIENLRLNKIPEFSH